MNPNPVASQHNGITLFIFFLILFSAITKPKPPCDNKIMRKISITGVNQGQAMHPTCVKCVLGSGEGRVVAGRAGRACSVQTHRCTSGLCSTREERKWQPLG